MLGQRYFGADTSVLCSHVARSDPTRWGRSRFLLLSPIFVVLGLAFCLRSRSWPLFTHYSCEPLASLLLYFPVPFRWCSKYPGAINQLIYCRSPGQYKFQYGRTMGQTALSLIDAHPAAPVQLCVLFAASPASRGAPLQLPLSARAVFRIIGS